MRVGGSEANSTISDGALYRIHVGARQSVSHPDLNNQSVKAGSYCDTAQNIPPETTKLISLVS